MDQKYPFTFLFGTGRLLPKFEENLYGLSEGDTFSFRLQPSEAYGPVEEGNILRFSRETFEKAGGQEGVQIREGNYVALTDDEGLTHNGLIRSCDEEAVTVDFNHAMAGLTLHFQGVVLHLRQASIDELVRQHYIPATGVHSREA